MINIIPYKVEEIKAELRLQAQEVYGLDDAQYEGSNISQMINMLAYNAAMNNINVTHGLNESFITQAKDSTNIRKHAFELSYNPKRKVSYQYKIRLKSKDEGNVIISKYSKFKSEGKDYVYLGEDLQGDYGSFINVEMLNNEYNNSLNGTNEFQSCNVEDYLRTEDGALLQVLRKIDEIDNQKFLVKTIDGEVVKGGTVQTSLYTKSSDFDISGNYVLNGIVNATKIDNDGTEFKIQIEPTEGLEFPVCDTSTEELLVQDNKVVVQGRIKNVQLFEVYDGTNYVQADINSIVAPVDGELAGDERGIDCTSLALDNDTQVRVTYKSDKNADGTLIHKFFSDDIKHSDTFDGFTCINFDAETGVLLFDITDSSTINDVDGVEMDVIFSSTKTNRISKCTTTIVDGEVTYSAFDKNTVFSLIKDVQEKKTIELIVQEGTVSKYTDFQDGDVEFPKYNKASSPKILKDQFILIDSKDVEDNGVEMFVTRTLPNGDIEENKLWTKRDFLIAEKSQGEDATYVVLQDLDFPEYLKVYSRYAGSGTKYESNMYFRFNILRSSGALGNTESLITPEFDSFEAVQFSDGINVVTNVIGADEEGDEEIREFAPLFNNTANRAVTKNDYVTICNKQSFVEKAQIWGGEEQVPQKELGHVFFSITPNSRKTGFSVKNANEFTLNNSNEREYFYLPESQISGDEKNSLFNILNGYKVITIQLKHKNPVYIDYSIKLNLLNRNRGETITESNIKVFNVIKEYFNGSIEVFDSTFFNSTMIKYIDKEVRDTVGFDMSVTVNASFNKDNFNVIHTNGLPNGVLDYEIFFGLPTESLFTPLIYNEKGEIEQVGDFRQELVYNLSANDCFTNGDKIFLDFDNKIGFNYVGNQTSVVDSNSVIIKIPVMYTFIRDDAQGMQDGELVQLPAYEDTVKIGDYIIYVNEAIVSFKIYTSTQDNFKEVKEYIQDGTGIDKPVFKSYANDTGIQPIPTNMLETTRILNINAKNDNINLKRTSFARLKSVVFTDQI